VFILLSMLDFFFIVFFPFAMNGKVGSIDGHKWNEFDWKEVLLLHSPKATKANPKAPKGKGNQSYFVHDEMQQTQFNDVQRNAGSAFAFNSFIIEMSDKAFVIQCQSLALYGGDKSNDRDNK